MGKSESVKKPEQQLSQVPLIKNAQKKLKESAGIRELGELYLKDGNIDKLKSAWVIDVKDRKKWNNSENLRNLVEIGNGGGFTGVVKSSYYGNAFDHSGATEYNKEVYEAKKKHDKKRGKGKEKESFNSIDYFVDSQLYDCDLGYHADKIYTISEGLDIKGFLALSYKTGANGEKVGVINLSSLESRLGAIDFNLQKQLVNIVLKDNPDVNYFTCVSHSPELVTAFIDAGQSQGIRTYFCNKRNGNEDEKLSKEEKDIIEDINRVMDKVTKEEYSNAGPQKKLSKKKRKKYARYTESTQARKESELGILNEQKYPGLEKEFKKIIKYQKKEFPKDCIYGKVVIARERAIEGREIISSAKEGRKKLKETLKEKMKSWNDGDFSESLRESLNSINTGKRKIREIIRTVRGLIRKMEKREQQKEEEQELQEIGEENIAATEALENGDGSKKDDKQGPKGEEETGGWPSDKAINKL